MDYLLVFSHDTKLLLKRVLHFTSISVSYNHDKNHTNWIIFFYLVLGMLQTLDDITSSAIVN